MTNSARRVVVTGVGMVTSLGLTADETWDAAIRGTSGTAPLTRCDLGMLPPEVAVAAEVKGFDPSPVMPAKEARRMDLFIQFALVAAEEALRQAGFEGLSPLPDGDRVGTIVGSGIGGIGTILATQQILEEKGGNRVSPFFIPGSIINLAAGQIAMRTGARGPTYAPVSACASSNHAIGEAFHAIRRGDADMMIAGGTEAAINPLSLAGYHAARALTTNYEAPERASRPFDRSRDGFVHGEGAAILVLETAESAEARGATVLAEVAGFGMSADAHHITSPPEDGAGAALAMRRALEAAGTAPEAIGYINAHATATPVGDAAECRAIRSVFGAHAERMPVSSTKSMFGHALGASAAIEAVLCVRALTEELLPPTINLRDPDPECGGLDIVMDTARAASVEYVISNAFGFGGANTTVVLRAG